MSGIMDYERPAITADCVLFTTASDRGTERLQESGTALQVRLVKRPNAPEEGKWALLGAFVPIDERIEDVMRSAVLTKGGYGGDFYAEQLHTFDTPGRDERWRVISVSYIGVIPTGAEAMLSLADASWFSINQSSETLTSAELGIEFSFDDLAFDHSHILRMGIERLREKTSSGNIALRFLNEPFQIKDIKRTVETITLQKSSNTQRVYSKFIERVMGGKMAGTKTNSNTSGEGDKSGVDDPNQPEQAKRPAHRPGHLYEMIK